MLERQQPVPTREEYLAQKEKDAEYDFLELKCIDAIIDNDFVKVEEILKTKCPHPFLRYKVCKFIPSPSCLSEAIYRTHFDFAKRLLGFPYFVIPDEGALAYSIYTNQHSLTELFLRRYRVKPTEATLQYAISACNVRIVKYLVNVRQVPLDYELLEEIYEKPEPHDDFPVEERLKRNRIIRRFLKRVFREEGITED